jgi:hypothetical protein
MPQQLCSSGGGEPGLDDRSPPEVLQDELLRTTFWAM